MTIFEAITRLDNLKPNNYTDVDKARWLSELDGKIKAEIIDTHEGAEDVTYVPYDTDTDTTIVELLAPHPFDEMYLKWLEAKIDYYNAEYGRYNNSITAFDESYSAFERYYNRTHKPKSVKLKFF